MTFIETRKKMRSMRRAALVLCLLIAAPALRAELLDTIVATVDTEVILLSEIDESAVDLIDEMDIALLPEDQQREQIASAQRQVLDQAIDHKILYREALLAGLPERMERLEALVDERLDSLRERYNSTKEFMDMLESAGETVSDVRDRVKKTILAMTIANSMLARFEDDVVIDESELSQYYEDNKSFFSHPAQTRIRRILITPGTGDDAWARAKARIEALREELSLGADFAELARAQSEGPEAENGGRMGWISHDPEGPDLIEILDRAVLALKPGEVSEAIETEYGFLLLKAEEFRAAGTEPLDTVRTIIEPQLRRNHAQDRFDKWVGELRKRSQVVVHRY